MPLAYMQNAGEAHRTICNLRVAAKSEKASRDVSGRRHWLFFVSPSFLVTHLAAVLPRFITTLNALQRVGYHHITTGKMRH